MKQSFAQIVKESKEELENKFFNKVPSWNITRNKIIIPGSLCVEQCSSEETALYKGKLALRISPADKSVADLTGGMGIDSWAFARTGRKVRYNEMNVDLATAAKANFMVLGLDNIFVTSEKIGPENIANILSNKEEYGLIYIDPARRNREGKKVFLIEDCQPDVLSLKDKIFEKTENILLKLSPMADLTMIARRLGPEVREIHVVESGKECKEVLVWLSKGWTEEYRIFVYANNSTFSFTRTEENEAKVSLPLYEEDMRGLMLYEPGPAMMKAAPFKLLCQRDNLVQLGVSTHLYLSREKGKEIINVMPFNGKSIKLLGKQYPNCEVTAKNIMMTSSELRKKLGSLGGAHTHIYGVKCDFANHESVKLLLITKQA